ncbi:MAG TPA: immunoglobulin domain-containing protein, partial [Verrucomicrobiae bacterium]
MKLRTTCNWRKASAALLWAFASLLCSQTLMAQSTFCWAIVAKHDLTLNGGALVDSFDSQDPNQSTGCQYDAAKRQDGGNIASLSASVGAVTDSGNTTVYGRAATTPGGSITLNGKSSIGSLAWVNGGNSGIQPGWYSNNLPAISIPDATLPGGTFSSLKKVGGTVGGTSYTYVITTGNYQGSANFSLSGNAYINGDVVLYFPSGFQISGQGYIYVSPGSKLTIYLGGQTTLSGGAIINGSGYAANCSLIGLPSCSSIQYSGNSSFIGTVYAPEAAFQMSGGGSTTINFAGAVVANSVVISGGYQFHYDESLCGCAAPGIVIPAMSLTNCPGMTATFSVGATGKGLTYQWFKGSTSLPAQTNSSLIISNTTANDSGTYTVIVTGACGMQATNSATLTVNANTIITMPPVNTTVCSGATANFSVNASGTGLAYQWYGSTGPLIGQTNSTLSLPGVSVANAGIYSVVVSGACGLPVTNSAMLTVNQSVTITTPPADTAACLNGTAFFSVAASGTRLGYQWYHGATLLSGQTNASLTVANVGPNDAGTYSVVVSDTCGNVVTNSAMLALNANVLIATPPSNATNCPGTSAHFSVNASGTGLGYQWYKGANLLQGQTSSTLTLGSVSAIDADVYSVVVSGVCGLPVTNSATLFVNANT